MPGIPNEVVDYLGLHHVMTLSTSSFTGIPHADTVVYASDNTRVFFYADQGSSLARNIKDSRYVSFTIDDYTTDWKKLREMQGVGRSTACDEQGAFVGLSLMARKFGAAFVAPPGMMYSVEPYEMHFVDYDYATVTSPPDISLRLFQIDDAPVAPSHGSMATSLDRMIYEPGEVIFRPGSGTGQYFVVVEGEVEIRGEGYGADQTVSRVRVGQLFGDRAALHGQRGGFTAHAITQTVLLAVERNAMRDIMLRADGDKPD